MTCNSIPNAARPRPGDGNACGGEARAIRFVLILACVLTQAGCDADRCLRHSDCPASFMCQEGLCQLRPVEGDAGPDSAMPSALDASTGPSARSDGSMRDAAAPAAADAGGDASSAPSSDGGAGDAQDGAPG
ncbi:MAG: hypothetical protein MJD61_00240 [Proteobacteria bacterium]|nr:hypothetical protein [Pseudomonadota bacterium]